MSIVLVRHGETLLNASRTMQPADTPLGPRGLAQAEAVARRIAAAHPNVAAVVSSDLPRAARTAEAIGAACGVPVAFEPLLQERNFGALRGLPYDDLGFDPLTMVEAPDGGESVAAFHDRVARAFAQIRALRDRIDGDLVVVSHGLVIGAMLERHARLDPAMTLPSRLSNTSVTILAAEPPHAVSLLDCTVHLGAAVDDDPHGLSGG
jgi:probable phosphoglycerate mutase